MASKGGGSRASGTDGSDFGYRQRVDTKYQKAASTRKSLKKVLLGLFVYYPCMLAFALVPSIVNGGGCSGGDSVGVVREVRIESFTGCDAIYTFIVMILIFGEHGR